MKTNGHIPGTTNIGEGYFVVATEAIDSPLPPGESGEHHFFRPYGDFVRVTEEHGNVFVGRWVGGLTVTLDNNGVKCFPKGSARPLTPDEIPVLVEMLHVLGRDTGGVLAIINELECGGQLDPEIEWA